MKPSSAKSSKLLSKGTSISFGLTVLVATSEPLVPFIKFLNCPTPSGPDFLTLLTTLNTVLTLPFPTPRATPKAVLNTALSKSKLNLLAVSGLSSSVSK